MKVVALAGGVGGAKLADGFAKILQPGELTIVVNTGDDFKYFGLAISPDLDTVCYTLAGMANPNTGWGQNDETWNTLTQLKLLDAPTWFSLGDRDLATHLERTRLLNNGIKLSEITKAFCDKWGVAHNILPMTDDKVATKIYDTNGRKLDFQEYFVQHRWQPEIRRIEFEGISEAQPSVAVMDCIKQADLVVLCPSNLYVSIDPILKLPGLLDLLIHKIVIAVSPIVGDQAIKGPLAKMIHEISGGKVSAIFPAEYYHRLSILDGYVLDNTDKELVPEIERQGIICKGTNIVMKSTSDRVQLAEDILALGRLMLMRSRNP